MEAFTKHQSRSSVNKVVKPDSSSDGPAGIPSLIAPCQTRKDHILNNNKVIPTKPSFLTCQEFRYSPRQNPIYSKHLKDRTPQISGIITMKEEMINSFSVSFTHSTQIYYYKVHT